MVPNGKQNDGPLEFWVFQPTKMGISHMSQTSNSLFITHLTLGRYGQPVVNKGKQWYFSAQMGYEYNTSKYTSNFKFPLYHPLNMWLLGAASDKQGQIMMDL